MGAFDSIKDVAINGPIQLIKNLHIHSSKKKTKQSSVVPHPITVKETIHKELRT